MSETGSDQDNDNHQSGEESDEDLGDLLASMDIDKDFNIWTSFRHSEYVSPRNSSSGDPLTTDSPPAAERSQAEAEEAEDIADWWERLQREEIYSRRYTPSASEKRELQDLEALLGMSKTILPGFMRRKSDDSLELRRASWNQVMHPEENADGNNLAPSILLKRGPALWEEEEYELILLTQGLVMAKVLAASASSTFEKKLVPRTFHRAILWSQVKYVSLDSLEESTAWEMKLTDGDESLVFVCASPRQCQAWLDAMEKVLIHYHMHTPASSHSGELGWQYKLIRKPGFTVAVTDQVDASHYGMIPPSDDLNKLDDYNEYAPLHYAVRANHVNAMRYLLDAGANPNVEDGDGRTPMYYAVRDELPRMTVTLLESYGAEKSKLAKAETKGELFGRVAATEAVVAENRREAEQKRQAEAAAAEMAENMRLLKQRGEKIEELDSKARELNEGAQNFAEMAAQLKEKSKGGSAGNDKDKKWWQVI